MIQPRSIFIGRTTELARLDALVRERARLVTLWGPGGAGKTTIASRWTDARRAGGGAVVWAELASVRTEPELLVALAMVLGTALDDHDDPPLAIVRSLEAQSALLVADNTEQLDATARATLGAIAARHERGVIVTSRDALGVEGEQTIAIDPLTDADALALYATLSGVEPDDAAQAIVRRLDALPLAIELAAARASLLGNDALLERLDRKLDVLGGPATSDGRPARHVTLRAAIAWSWELLEDTDREALITCALFDGPFDAALVEGAMSVAELSALDSLERLRQRALLHVSTPDEAGRPRLFLLEAVRDFARDELTRSGRSAELFERHAAAVIARTEPLARRVRRGGTVDPSLSNRRADLVAASTRGTSSAPLATLCLAALCSVTGPVGLVVDLVDRLLGGVSEPTLRARLVIAKGEALRAMGRHPEAEVAANEALQLTGPAEQDEARSIGADALRLAGVVARSRGEADRAATLLSSARERYALLGDRALEGICVGEIGAAHQSRGELDLARARHAEAIAVHVVEGSLRAEGVDRSYLAVATHRSGEPRSATTLHEEALAIHQRVGHRRLEGAELLHLGFVHHELGASAAARSAFGAARKVLAAAGARGLEALAMVLDARLDVDEGEAARARVTLVEAERASPRGWARLQATRLLVLGHLSFATDPQAAAAAYAAALEASRDIEVGFEALTPAYLALALARVGTDPKIVTSHLEAARALVATTTNRFIADALSILCGDKNTASDEALASSSEVRRALVFAGARRALTIEDDARSIVLPNGRTLDLSRRRNVRLLILALAHARRERPGAALANDALIAAGWPDERLSATAATKRLHTAIWTLRSLGFEDVLVSSEEGYFLDPRVRVDLR